MQIKANLVALAAMLLLAGIVSADGIPTVERWVIGGGGGSVSGGSYRLNGTVGQPIVGTATSGSHQLCAGFWCGAMPDHAVYLPLVLRG